MTLGEQLSEIQTSLSAARTAITSKIGDKEVQRSYSMLLKEKNEILKKIDTHGADYTEGQNTIPKSAKAGIYFV